MSNLDEESYAAIGYIFQDVSAREMAIMGPDLVTSMAWWLIGVRKPVTELAITVAYGDTYGRMTKRRVKTVDVDDLVQRWLDTLIALSTAHDAETRNRAEEQTSTLLEPLLTAPIRQVREFVQKLAARLRTDERVPFLIWSTFEKIVRPIVLKGPDGEMVVLRQDLAEEIARTVEQRMDRNELVIAIAEALQWRPPEQLRRVQEALQAGKQPRVRGRESCLFLEFDDLPDVMVQL